MDGVKIGGHILAIPSVAKALLRIAKLAISEKKSLVIEYPHYYCNWLPLLIVSCYFSRITANRQGLPRILLLTNSKETVQEYRRLTNEDNLPFVEYIYSGYLNSSGFARIKPEGSTRGRAIAKIGEEQSQVMISSPAFFKPDSAPYDAVILENAQIMLKRRNRAVLQQLAELESPIIAIVTVPSGTALDHLRTTIKSDVFGWSESQLVEDIRLYQGKDEVLPECVYPKITIERFGDDSNYVRLLNLAWLALSKSYRLLRSHSLATDDDRIERILVEIKYVLWKFSHLCVPLEVLCQAEKERGYQTITQRIALGTKMISELPARLSEGTELQNPLNLCRAVSECESPKTRFLGTSASSGTCRIVATDETYQVALRKHYHDAIEICSPKYPAATQLDWTCLIGVSWTLDANYRLVKVGYASNCHVLCFDHEVAYLETLASERAKAKTMLSDRAQLLTRLRLAKYLSS